MTPSPKPPQGTVSTGKGLLILLAGGAAIWTAVWAVSGGANLSRRDASAPQDVQTGSQSSVLGMTIPGAMPFQSGERGARVLQAGQEASELYEVGCTTSREAFVLTDDITALDAVNRHMQATGYDRTDLHSGEAGVIFKTSTPKNVFALIAGDGFFICEY